MVEGIRRKTEFCRDLRNRRFAHHDLLLAMQDAKATALPKATKESFFGALDAISDLLNEMERFYYKGGCSFKEIVPHKGAATLLFILGFGVMARDEMLERINKGDFSGDRPENI